MRELPVINSQAPLGYTKVPCEFSSITGLRGFIQFVAFPCYSCQMCSLQLFFLCVVLIILGEKLRCWSPSFLLPPVCSWTFSDIADAASPVLLEATVCIVLP